MKAKRLHQLIHVISTAWFVICASYLLVTALRQVGTAWWVIFSLGGYSAVIVFILLSIYLVAVYRGVRRSDVKAEYPLTASPYYMIFYDFTPFIGSAAGCLSTWGITTSSVLNMIAVGSLATTFCVWIIMDPVVAYFEMLLPQPRALRHQRIAAEKAEHLKIKQETSRILDTVSERERTARQKWQQALEPMAESLSAIIAADHADFTDPQRHVVELGIKAWLLGGIDCMKRLHEMVLAKHTYSSDRPSFDYISVWWDGIGTWRQPELAKCMI